MRRVLFRIALAALVVLCIEAFACAAWRIERGEFFSFRTASEARRSLLASDVAGLEAAERRPVWLEGRGEKFILHPYVGAIDHPSHRADPHWWLPGVSGDSLAPDDAFHVVITGGSVADYFAGSGFEELRSALEGLPARRDRRIQLVNLADRGRKQPQQLMAVAYFLALGGRIDLLINIDGFNEVGLEYRANLDHGIFPAYPWTWVPLTKGMRSPAEVASLGEIHGWRFLRKGLARAMEPLSFSVTANLLWQQLDAALARAEFRATEAQVRAADLPMASRGPRFEGSREEAFAFGVELWANASRALHHLALGNGFPYFHFLQPNQYLDGSKPFSEREERHFRSRAELREQIPRWYPELVARGGRLRAQGVHFHDLSRLFADVREDAYTDSCCHLSPLGNRLLARKIGGVIAESNGSDGGGEAEAAGSLAPPPSRGALAPGKE